MYIYFSRTVTRVGDFPLEEEGSQGQHLPGHQVHFPLEEGGSQGQHLPGHYVYFPLEEGRNQGQHLPAQQVHLPIEVGGAQQVHLPIEVGGPGGRVGDQVDDGVRGAVSHNTDQKYIINIDVSKQNTSKEHDDDFWFQD